MQNTIFVIMAIIKVKLPQSLKLNFRTGYDDVTEKGNVPLYDLRKYIKIKIRAILYIRKWGLLQK